MEYAIGVKTPTILISAWNHDVGLFCRSVFKDSVKFGIILLSLQVFWIILKRMELAGYPASELEYFEKVHFCTLLAAFVVLCLDFLIKLMISSFGRGK